jgi:Zn-dependent M28 family amino/carboxypeptidase
MRPLLAAAAVTALPLALGAAPPAAVFTPAEKAAAGSITPARLRAHIRYLAHDLLEGRGPGSRGDQLAQTYIATQMEAMGLEPAGENGTWYQPFDIVGVDTENPATTLFRKGSDSVQLKYHDEFIASSGLQAPSAGLEDAELVFVGYGIVAPEHGWDDFKGVDMKGKVLVVMNNDPESDPALFAGKTRLYYGRWTYKYEQAARTGAAGAIIIHTTPSAGYGWNVIQTSWSGEQFGVPEEGPQLQVKAWVTEDSARKLATLGGQELDALRAAAQKKDFKPVPLGVSWSIALKNQVSRTKTANVLGRLPGSDPVLSKEAVVYSAHHDHLGVRKDAKPGEDAIYNGAKDNASGVAALLSLAEAMRSLKPRPKRSILFAAVAAEEQGLLGATYFAAHPTMPPGRMAANINIDGINIFGRTRDIAMIGLGKSSLDEWIEKIVAAQGRVVKGDQFPDRGFFYRSDQFALARIGVPAAYFDDGVEVIGKPADWGKQQQEKFEATDYHQPSDELRDSWELSGAVEDVQLDFYLGVKVANDAKMPTWKAGDEFEGARKKALAELK